MLFFYCLFYRIYWCFPRLLGLSHCLHRPSHRICQPLHRIYQVFRCFTASPLHLSLIDSFTSSYAAFWAVPLLFRLRIAFVGLCIAFPGVPLLLSALPPPFSDFTTVFSGSPTAFIRPFSVFMASRAYPPPIDSFRNSPLPLSVFQRLSRFHTTFFSFSPPFSASPPPKFIYPAFFVPFLDYWARKWTEMMILTSFG